MTNLSETKIVEYTKDNICDHLDLPMMWTAHIIQLINDSLMTEEQCALPTDHTIRASARAYFFASHGEVAEHRELVLTYLGFDADAATRSVRRLIEEGKTQKDILKMRDAFEKALKANQKALRKRSRVTK